MVSRCLKVVDGYLLVLCEVRHRVEGVNVGQKYSS